MALKLITIRVDEEVLDKIRKAYPNMKYNATIRHILGAFAKRIQDTNEETDQTVTEVVKEMEL